jgi:hypothetical protein
VNQPISSFESDVVDGSRRQRCRELDAPHRRWLPQLDPHWTPENRTACGRDPLRGRKLPSAQIAVRDYLADVLPGLANTKMQSVTDLAPAAWAKRHSSVDL